MRSSVCILNVGFREQRKFALVLLRFLRRQGSLRHGRPILHFRYRFALCKNRPARMQTVAIDNQIEKYREQFPTTQPSLQDRWNALLTKVAMSNVPGGGLLGGAVDGVLSLGAPSVLERFEQLVNLIEDL